MWRNRVASSNTRNSPSGENRMTPTPRTNVSFSVLPDGQARMSTGPRTDAETNNFPFGENAVAVTKSSCRTRLAPARRVRWGAQVLWFGPHPPGGAVQKVVHERCRQIGRPRAFAETHDGA